MVSTNWITNILHQADIAKVCIPGKYIQGYVHDFVVSDHFSMTLELEEQYNCTTLEAIGNIFKLMCITFGTSCEMMASARTTFVSLHYSLPLLFVSLLDQTITYIDPFGANRSKCEDVRLNWKKFCSTRNVLKEKTWTISPDSYIHSKQNDSFSCGVFIC